MSVLQGIAANFCQQLENEKWFPQCFSRRLISKETCSHTDFEKLTTVGTQAADRPVLTKRFASSRMPVGLARAVSLAVSQADRRRRGVTTINHCYLTPFFFHQLLFAGKTIQGSMPW